MPGRTLSFFTAILLLASLQPALADDAQLLREMQDRKEIEALMWRYVRALDTLDADAYATVFTEDGRFGSGANATEGREALREMVIGLREGRAERLEQGGDPTPPMHHIITNSRIEFIDEDHARYHSYWMTVFGTNETTETPNVAAVGRGVDELVRVDGEWLIRSRNVAPGD